MTEGRGGGRGGDATEYEGRGRKDEGIRDSDFGEGKGDNDVDDVFVTAPLVLRRVLGTLAEVLRAFLLCCVSVCCCVCVRVFVPGCSFLLCSFLLCCVCVFVVVCVCVCVSGCFCVLLCAHGCFSIGFPLTSLILP